MTNIVAFRDKHALEEEAALWLARIDSGEMLDEHRQQLQAWVDGDQRHRQALKHMAEVWGQLDALTILAELFPLHTDARTESQRGQRSAAAWARAHTVGVAATFATSVVIAVIFVFNGYRSAGSEPTELVYQTQLGEQSFAELKDGSIITLNTQSIARVRFDDHERAVYLEHGEAHFKVAKNPDVPFVVYAGKGHVRAVGTAFSVRIDKQEVDVTVSEGKVEVFAGLETAQRKTHQVSTGKPLNTVTLSERGVAKYGESIDTYDYIEPKQLSHKLAWKSGKWIFEGDTLADVIAEANRYTTARIEISDPSIANLRVGGYFDVGDVEPLLAALEAGFDIKVNRTRDDLIQLSSAR
jgi:transmembrane sensor